MAGVAIFPTFGAIYYWVPKMWGRLLHEGWGKVSFWTMFVGFNLAFFPMHLLGLLGMTRRIYTYQPGLGWTGDNLTSTIGAFLLAVGILITFVNWVWSQRHGEPAGRNPWGADTLEFATSSPPAEYDFETIPQVRSLHPVWDQPELAASHQTPEAGGRTLVSGHDVLSTSLLDATPEAVVKLPKDTLWPFALSIALTLFFYGALVRIVGLAVAGGAFTVITFFGWMWPRGSTQET